MEYSEGRQDWLKRRKIKTWQTRKKRFSKDPIIIRLMNRRIALEMTQKEVAAKVGISENVICYCETGRGSTTIFNVVAWANALGFTLELRDQVNE